VKIIIYNISIIHEKNRTEVFKNWTRCRSENNFLGPWK